MTGSRWIGVLGADALACASEGSPAPGGDTEAAEGSTIGETSADPSTTISTGSSDASQGTETSSDPDGSESGSETGDPPPPAGGCFGPGERPASVSASGIAMPSLGDERAAYTSFGWTRAPEAEPSYPGEPDFSVVDPDIHGSTEGDDLWTWSALSSTNPSSEYAIEHPWIVTAVVGSTFTWTLSFAMTVPTDGAGDFVDRLMYGNAIAYDPGFTSGTYYELPLWCSPSSVTSNDCLIYSGVSPELPEDLPWGAMLDTWPLVEAGACGA